MPVPAKRRSSSKLRRTRAHIALKKIQLVPCAHCKKQILPHKVCPYCGQYKGREVVKILLGKVQNKKN